MGKPNIARIEKEVEHDIRKNWKKIILIIAASVIIISFIFLITGLRIRFAISDSLIIHLSPSDKSFSIPNDQNQNITFHTSIDDNIFCSANCSYTFYDRSGEKIVDSGSLILKNKNFFSRSYQLAPYRKGSGQKIYNFDAQCSNIKSFLCATKSPIRRKSSFITLNYRLTEEEEKIKSELKPVITKSFLLINNASKNLQESAFILNSTNEIIGFRYLYDWYSATSKNLDNSLEQANEIFRLWSQESYLTLNVLYGSILTNQSDQLYETSDNLLNNITTSIKNQNNLSVDYNNLKDYLLDISKSKEQYIYYSDLKENLAKDFNIIYDYLKSVNINIFKQRYGSLSDFERDLTNMSILISEFNKTLSRNYESIITKGKNLSSFEYSKKCYLGYCENATDNVCLGLNKILLDYKENLYNAPLNTSISDIQYYVRINDSVKILVSNESEDYYKEYCSNLTSNISLFQLDIPDIQELNLPDLSNLSIEYPIKNELTENPPMCCVYGECLPCCTSEECSNNPHLFPVVFIHGHSLLKKTSPEPLLDGFNKIQYQLQEDGYINAGTIYFDFNASDYNRNEWGLSGFPITIKASYYYDYFYSLGGYAYITRNADNLDTYAIRLNDIIELIKYRTGKPKVNIIAHSMGGLVARRYIQIFSEGSVDKLVLIATPNKGIEGDIKKFCRVFGETRECEDMYADSVFIKKLNSPTYTPKETKFYTITGKGCKTAEKDGDGISTSESSVIDYAKPFVTKGKCGDILKGELLHSELLDIDKYPQVYEHIKEILS